MSFESPQNKKIDLVNTPIHRNATDDNEDYLPPLGLGYIGTAVEKTGNKVEIIDCVQERIGVKQAIEKINNSDAEFVGVNVFSQNLELVKEILLSLDRDKKVLIGGQASKFLQTELLSLPTKNETIIIIGEAEKIVPEIINGEVEEAPLFEDDNKKIYLIGQNSKYYSEDISSLELDRNLLIQNISKNHYGKKEIAIITSRGCPFDCAFCGGARGLNAEVKPRQKSDESIISEIIQLQKMYPGIQSIRILDDLFLKNPKGILRATEIFSKFTDVSWRSMIHATSIGTEHMIPQKMKDSGCEEVFMGIESGSKNIRDYINKVGSIELVTDSIRKLLIVGIDVKGYFIFGFPNETKEDFEKTFRLAKQIKMISLKTKGKFRTSVFKFRPYHGTKIYNELLDQGKNILPIRPSIDLGVTKRNQFNFDAGNFSNESEEILNEYIKMTQEL
jgi:anaerobic magnesium-protoporphyrin IX monomethyl ester cyclase